MAEEARTEESQKIKKREDGMRIKMGMENANKGSCLLNVNFFTVKA